MATTKRLTPAQKKKWVAALRSGRYMQGLGYLHDHGTYCCLGVLACTLGAKPEDFGYATSLTRDDGINSKFCVLPIITQERLWTLNDDDEMPFDLIAQYIEDDPRI